MTQLEQEEIRAHMHSLMLDSAHDAQHVERVLRQALCIAKAEGPFDEDVLIAACLLHDIARDAQSKDPNIDHAQAGADRARDYLLGKGWPREKAQHVRDCIGSHRYRGSNPPVSSEAKALFDADKLEATGAIGIARTLLYDGAHGSPLYSVDAQGVIRDGRDAGEPPSFLREYHGKLKHIYDRFYTKTAAAMGQRRKKAMVDFVDALYAEIDSDAQG